MFCFKMKSKFFADLLLMSLLVLICTVVVSKAQCFCTQQYDPVCGSNGITYGNECELNCDLASNPGLYLAYRGECRDCSCSREYNPVCGSDRRTYSNPCIFRCLAGTGVRVAYRGRCLGLGIDISLGFPFRPFQT